MRVLFCHGLESAPQGRKSVAIAQAGHEVVAPDCQGQDLATRVGVLRAAIVDSEPDVVVGSSFGGIAGLLAVLEAANDKTPVGGLLLCAPALQLPVPMDLQQPLRPPCPTVILHGTGDDVIPVEVSRRFAEEHGVRLVEVDDDHRLQRSLPIMLELLAGMPS